MASVALAAPVSRQCELVYLGMVGRAVVLEHAGSSKLTEIEPFSVSHIWPGTLLRMVFGRITCSNERRLQRSLTTSGSKYVGFMERHLIVKHSAWMTDLRYG